MSLSSINGLSYATLADLKLLFVSALCLSSIPNDKDKGCRKKVMKRRVIGVFFNFQYGETSIN